jgi:hypothetical protein
MNGARKGGASIDLACGVEEINPTITIALWLGDHGAPGSVGLDYFFGLGDFFAALADFLGAGDFFAAFFAGDLVAALAAVFLGALARVAVTAALSSALSSATEMVVADLRRRSRP